MKNLKLALLGLIGLACSTTLFAQEWNDEQKEIWAFVENYSQAAEAGNYEAFMNVFHEDYKGWSYEAPVPMDKKTVGKYVKMEMENYETVFGNRTPLSIQVFDDFAVVDYIFHGMAKNKNSGETQEFAGRWTDILMKDGKNWYLVADHGGRYPEKR
jgi:ketosteroid isomerase-like protein